MKKQGVVFFIAAFLMFGVFALPVFALNIGIQANLTGGTGGTLQSGDQAIYDHLVSKGHTVTTTHHTDAFNFTGLDLVYISASITSSNAGDAFAQTTVPIICCEAAAWDNLGMTPLNYGGTNVTGGSSQAYVWEDTQAPVPVIITGTQTIYTTRRQCYGINAANWNAKLINVAVFAHDPTVVCVAALEKGAALPAPIAGLTAAPARRVSMFMLGNEPAGTISQGTFDLLDSMVAWAAGTPGPVPTVAAVTGFAASTAPGVAQVNLSWADSNTVETNYIVQRRVRNGADYATLATLPSNSVAFNDTVGLVNGTGYDYRVRAFDSVANYYGNAEYLLTTATATSVSGPTITAQPQNRAVAVGEATSFTVTATGTGTLSYLWRKAGSPDADVVNGGSISGATSFTLTINPVAEANAGSYYCVVTDTNGSIPSDAALLTVNKPPVVSTIGTLNVPPSSAYDFAIGFVEALPGVAAADFATTATNTQGLVFSNMAIGDAITSGTGYVHLISARIDSNSAVGVSFPAIQIQVTNTQSGLSGSDLLTVIISNQANVPAQVWTRY